MECKEVEMQRGGTNSGDNHGFSTSLSASSYLRDLQQALNSEKHSFFVTGDDDSFLIAP